MPSTYQILASNTLSASASSVIFSAIPLTYADLVLRISARTDQTSQATSALRMTFNGSNTSSNNQLQGSGTSAASSPNGSTAFQQIGTTNGPTSTANTFSSQEIYIPNYSVTATKQFSSHSAQENNTTAAFIDLFAIFQNETQTITSITITPGAAPNFVAGSTFYLYGIAKS
jgi:hypothetical protein